MKELDGQFAVRIVKTDHYMASPIPGLDVVYSKLKNRALTRVPVIRIFGITPEGKKTCVHLHGVFPYVCVPYDGIASDKFLFDLSIALERSLTSEATISDTTQFVYKIELISGLPYYGFHSEIQQFLKIYFIYPSCIEKALEVLQSGKIMSRSFQPHEAHIPYILQTFIDYNMYGMNFVYFKDVSYRTASTMKTHNYSSKCAENLTKVSVCEVEVDVLLGDVVQNFNSTELNPGIAAIWEDAKNRRRCLMESSQLTPVSSQDRPQCLPSKSENHYLDEIGKILQQHVYNDSIGPQGSVTVDESLPESSFALIDNLSQVSFNDEDVELCNILGDLINMNVPDPETKNELLDVKEHVSVDEEDEICMSQRVGDDEDILYNNFLPNNVMVPQVDGPIDSPTKDKPIVNGRDLLETKNLTKSAVDWTDFRSDEENQDVALKQSIAEKDEVAFDADDSFDRIIEIEGCIEGIIQSVEKRDDSELRIKIEGERSEEYNATSLDSLLVLENCANVFEISANDENDEVLIDLVIDHKNELSFNPPSVECIGEYISDTTDVEVSFMEIEINGSKVRVSVSDILDMNLNQLGRETVAIDKLSASSVVKDIKKVNSQKITKEYNLRLQPNRSYNLRSERAIEKESSSDDDIVEIYACLNNSSATTTKTTCKVEETITKHPVVVLERLDEQTINSYCNKTTVAAIPPQKDKKHCVQDHCATNIYAKFYPSKVLQMKMNQIVSNQNRLRRSAPLRKRKGTNATNFSVRSQLNIEKERDVMYNLSCPSPMPDAQCGFNSPPICYSPTFGEDGNDGQPVRSQTPPPPIPSTTLILRSYRPKKYHQQKATKPLSQRPPRSRHKKVGLKNEDSIAAKFLEDNFNGSAMTLCSVDVQSTNVLLEDVTNVGATETIGSNYDDIIQNLDLETDDSTEVWKTVLGIPKPVVKATKAKKVPVKRTRTPKQAPCGPKRPRGRPKKSKSPPSSTSQSAETLYSQSLRRTTQESDWFIDQQSSDLNVNDDASPAVVVEPVAGIYSDNLTCVYNEMTMWDDTPYNSTLTEMVDGGNEVVSLEDAQSSSLCYNPFANGVSFIYDENNTGENNFDKAENSKNDDLLSEIENLVSKMSSNDAMSWDVSLSENLFLGESGTDGDTLANGSSSSELHEMLTSLPLISSNSQIQSTDCSRPEEGGENVPDLSQNIQSFYDYSTFPTEWLGDSSMTPSDEVDGDAAPASSLNAGRIYTPCTLPPPPSLVENSLERLGIPFVRHEEVHCSDPADAGSIRLGGGALVVKLKSKVDLEEAESVFLNNGLTHWKNVLEIASACGDFPFSNVISHDKVVVAEEERPVLYRGSVCETSLLPPSPQNAQKWLDKQIPTGKPKPNVEIATPSVSQKCLDIFQSSSTTEAVILSPILSSSSVIGTPELSCSKQFSQVSESTPLSGTRSKEPNSKFAVGRRRLSLRRNSLTQECFKVVDGLTCLEKETSQLDGPTPKNPFGFKISEESSSDISRGRTHQFQHLTVMSVELHADCIGTLLPDPKKNEIRAIVYHITKDSPPDCENVLTGVIYTDIPKVSSPGSCLVEGKVKAVCVASELEMISTFLKLFQDHDPDILLGYEIQMSSWGFLMERASVLGLDILSSLSRIPDDRGNAFHAPGSTTGFLLNLVGRIVLSVGVLMKSEIALYNYSFETVAYHVLHRRVPLFSCASLRDWFNSPLSRWRTIQHILIRAKGNFQLLDSLNVIVRTSEMARLFGIQFQEVLTRGSQFRVESMMLRLCRHLGYVAVSPNVQQRAAMRAPECLPLIMEPVSKYFTDPVIVLDFQSLYPSIIIAYNYCFSTCLGRVSHFEQGETFPFGCTSLKVSPDLLKQLKGNITVSPCGVAFVKSNVRKGVLPRMLEEILAARVMVKLEMKKRKSDVALQRMLDARQLGLKLIANVTYGYTAANYSGRMPCNEVADSVVSKGRETLERAIQLIEDMNRWGLRVVYGDTDSIFVLAEGRTKRQAFDIGKEIVEAVNAVNPKPVKLKLEKVYLPCLLETKKRYVGFMYETPDVSEPVYDAKGIETVRRDGCPAVAKILERSLKILFRTSDVSQVKSYVQHQFHKLISGRCGLNEYIFTREYRGRDGYRAANHAPALKIAKALHEADHRSEPRAGERVQYVIVYGKPGDALIELVRQPSQILMDPSLRINANYYINNVICAALRRAFSLIGADVNQWYSSLPRTSRFSLPPPLINQEVHNNTISHYFLSAKCPVCDGISKSGICANCLKDPQGVVVILNDRARELERRYQHISQVCNGCTGVKETRFSCISTDCPILYRLALASRGVCQAENLRRLIDF